MASTKLVFFGLIQNTFQADSRSLLPRINESNSRNMAGALRRKVMALVPYQHLSVFLQTIALTQNRKPSVQLDSLELVDSIPSDQSLLPSADYPDLTPSWAFIPAAKATRPRVHQYRAMARAKAKTPQGDYYKVYRVEYQGTHWACCSE